MSSKKSGAKRERAIDDLSDKAVKDLQRLWMPGGCAS